MAINTSVADTARLSASELRRRLTMPAGEHTPPPAIPEEDDFDLPEMLRPVKPGASVAHHTPTPKESLRVKDIMKPAGPTAGPGRPISQPNVDLFFPDQAPVRSAPNAGPGDANQLLAENGELRALLDEMRQLLQEASDNDARQKAELEQKNAQIAELQQMMQAFEEQLAGIGEPAKPKNADELEEWADELERENTKLRQMRSDLDAERRAQRQDEQELQNQMREMEVSMAKERAVMARQEIELRRLNSEIQQELELMQRGDPALRQQMSLFQRRHQDIVARAGAAPSTFQPGPPMAQPVDQLLQAPQNPEAPQGGRGPDSGIFRRMFKK